MKMEWLALLKGLGSTAAIWSAGNTFMFKV